MHGLVYCGTMASLQSGNESVVSSAILAIVYVLLGNVILLLVGISQSSPYSPYIRMIDVEMNLWGVPSSPTTPTIPCVSSVNMGVAFCSYILISFVVFCTQLWCVSVTSISSCTWWVTSNSRIDLCISNKTGGNVLAIHILLSVHVRKF